MKSGNLEMIAEIGKKELVIREVHTHIDAREIIEMISNVVLSKNLKMAFDFEGSPGPLGRGMTIRIRFSRELSDVDVNALRKIFELRKIPVIITR